MDVRNVSISDSYNQMGRSLRTTDIRIMPNITLVIVTKHLKLIVRLYTSSWSVNVRGLFSMELRLGAGKFLVFGIALPF